MKPNHVFGLVACSLITVVLLVASCSQPRPATPVTTPRTSPPSQPMPPTQKATTGLREVRAVWVSNTDKLDWDRATATLQQAGYNTMYVNFASGGAAFYPSQLVPTVKGIDGDPLARGVALARERGIQVHAKLIATFMFRTTAAFQDKLLAADRVMRGPTGQPIEQAGYYWLCPSQPANRDLLVGLTREMLTRYPVSGYHLDYIRFCEQPSCYCNHCRVTFEEYISGTVRHWPKDAFDGYLVERFKGWQQRVITDRVEDLTRAVSAIDPALVRSAAVFPDIKRARDEKAQNWQAWLRARFVHYVCPMNYNASPAEFRELLANQSEIAGDPRRVVAGIGSWKLNRLDDVADLINASRAANCYGFSLFSYDDCEERNFLPRFKTSN